MICSDHPFGEIVRRCSRLGALAFLIIFPAGCEERLKAPPLVQGEAVYYNRRERFRLEPPSGWSQQSRVEFPPGRYETERVLVKYKRLDVRGPAFFRASLIDLPESTTPVEYLEKRPGGPEKWQIGRKTESVSVGGITGTLVTYTGIWEEGEKEDVVKEVVAVRRGERVYFFTGIFAASDKTARALVRKAVNSVVWDQEGT
jgi:hypothetical protein